jgi:hypothetical protein
LIVVMEKSIAKIGEQLQGRAGVFEQDGSEGVDQGAAGTLGPVSTDEVGKVQQGFGAILLAG